MVNGKTRCNSAASIKKTPTSPLDAEILPVFMALRMVDLLLPVAFAACVRVSIISLRGALVARH
jgi:hypothetical protein